MSDLPELDTALKNFSGRAPLFPLPNIVLFPHALLPLHIFEDRYRRMMADTLDGERLIAMSLLRPGWEGVAKGEVAPVHRVVGLGKIIAHEKLADGRYYLVLRGLARANLLREEKLDLPYRVGQLEICLEAQDESLSYDRQERIKHLVTAFAQLFPKIKLNQLFAHDFLDLPLGTVTDVLLGSVPLPAKISQQFQEELNIDTRSEMLMDLLQEALEGQVGSAGRTFPPVFSMN
ncbi:LON peptidase substrate-binding domain-containing protein [Schlesneria sp. T3-172]|uniref:LON peptidase substrate-binding domain-containing protein n=1 Tax=Schlesneria TaxID=656899 RepID=UPI002F1458F4